MIDFSPMWELMKEKGISQYYLLKKIGIDSKILASIKKNGNITLCRGMQCTPNDIVRFIDDEV